jgi:hypothetical protein
MSDESYLKNWGTRLEALEIIATAITIEKSLSAFCNVWNSGGLKVRFYQAKRNQLTSEIFSGEEIKVVFRPRVTPDSFSLGSLSQLKEWLAPNAITDVILKWVGMGMQSHCVPDGTIYWTSPWPAGYVPGDQFIQWFEVCLDDVRDALPHIALALPSPPETAKKKPQISDAELLKEMQMIQNAGRLARRVCCKVANRRTGCTYAKFSDLWKNQLTDEYKLDPGETPASDNIFLKEVELSSKGRKRIS